MRARELFEWLDNKGYLRCKVDRKGFGDAFYTQKLLKDMKKDNWFDSQSESIKKDLATVGSLKNGTEIGPDGYVIYGIATFY